jgi:hypothetical protein
MVGLGREAAANWMGAKRPIWWRSPVVRPPPDRIAGACSDWPIACRNRHRATIDWRFTTAVERPSR